MPCLLPALLTLSVISATANQMHANILHTEVLPNGATQPSSADSLSQAPPASLSGVYASPERCTAFADAYMIVDDIAVLAPSLLEGSDAEAAFLWDLTMGGVVDLFYTHYNHTAPVGSDIADQQSTVFSISSIENYMDSA
jgi:hypothetical protein